MSLIFSKILTEEEVAEIILEKSTQVAHHFLTVWGEKGKGKTEVKKSKGRISWEQAQDASKGKSLRASKEVNNYH